MLIESSTSFLQIVPNRSKLAEKQYALQVSAYGVFVPDWAFRLAPEVLSEREQQAVEKAS
jgi:hypothetical protein